MIKKFASLMSLLAILIVGGCGVTSPDGPPRADQSAVAELAGAIRALGPEVDPEEATRAAEIAYDYTHQLALQYQITDPPLIHNMKVNHGLRPRGLCWHWAEDMEARLKQENFRTLTLHRAIANADNPFRIDHSTAIISKRGDGMFDGIVIDPWRYGGQLHWSLTREDTRYNWRPRREVLDERRRRREGSGSAAPAG
ncbi:hypothetical protein [Aliiroseovarius sp. YM-037]|uniref:hypothetical protein n=1 Tax=Aliiroseovarius sp. YM-037 TaxID=3341728 RepID=UPI003A7FC032